MKKYLKIWLGGRPYSLNIGVNFRDLIVNTFAEIIDCFILSNMFAINYTSVYCTSNVLYSETPQNTSTI